MITYLGEFTYKFDYQKKLRTASPTAEEVCTYNILLESGVLDLETYFINARPPVHPSEIAGFWKEMYRIAEALLHLHEFPSETGDTGAKCYGSVL